MRKALDFIHKRPIIAVLLIAAVLQPEVAHAYVDPGSGSVIVTAILGFFAAIGYTCRKQFYRLRRFFARKDE